MIMNFYNSCQPVKLFKFTRLGIFSILVSLFLIACTSSTVQPSKILVAAAASLQKSLQEITPLYNQTHPNQTVTYNFAASGALAQQISQGAPVDVFISAATKQMRELEAQGLLLSGSQRDLLTNQLVLITPKQSSVTVRDFLDLTKPEVKRIAIGQPLSVPAGQYATEVLQNLKILPQVQSKLVLGNSVKSVLATVETGDVEAGMVYITDAQISDKVTVVATAEPKLHAPIRYPMAVIRSSKSLSQAQQYIEFLQTASAKAVFRKYGFGIGKS